MGKTSWTHCIDELNTAKLKGNLLRSLNYFNKNQQRLNLEVGGAAQGIMKGVLGDPEVTANIYCKSRKLPNTDTQNYSTDLR